MAKTWNQGENLSKITVYLDGLVDNRNKPVQFEALTNGRRWNGWATPYFKKEEADRLVVAFNARQSNEKDTIARYDQDKDVYVFVDDELDPPSEEYGGIDVGGLHLYPIGAASWCWSAVGDFEDA